MSAQLLVSEESSAAPHTGLLELGGGWVRQVDSGCVHLQQLSGPMKHTCTQTHIQTYKHSHEVVAVLFIATLGRTSPGLSDPWWEGLTRPLSTSAPPTVPAVATVEAEGEQDRDRCVID